MTTQAASKIAARIKALLAKSVENGATEEEALAAMQKARELMDKYGITPAALEAEAETIRTANVKRDGWGTFIIKDRIASNVAIYTDCKLWITPEKKFAILGSETDRLFCEWLLDSLDQYIRRACVEFIKAQPKLTGNRWDHEKAFCIGAIKRINARLTALIAERRRSVKTSDGKSLVIVKSQLVESAFAKLGMRLGNSKNSVRYKRNDAYAAGESAGNKASFSKPVNGGAGVKAIAG